MPAPGKYSTGNRLSSRKFLTLSGSLLWWLLFSIVVLIVLYCRVRLLDTPLERDEGDYAYHAQLILDGVSLNDELIRKRFPTIYYIYAFAIGILGQTVTAIHFMLLVANLATAWLIIQFVQRYFTLPVAICAGITFLFLTLSPVVDGFSSNREHFVMLAVMGALNVQFLAFQRQKGWLYYATGFLYGLAFTIKEPAIAFIVFGSLWFLIESFRNKSFQWVPFLVRGLLFTAGVFTPYLLILLQFLLLGALSEFIFMNYTLKGKYASSMSPEVGLKTLFDRLKNMIAVSPLLWILLIPGFLAPVFNRSYRHQLGLLALLGMFSFLATVPGWYFRAHYFLLMMPAWAILMTIGIFMLVQLTRWSLNRQIIVAGTILLVGWCYVLYTQSQYLFKASAIEAVRINYGYNPFPEAVVIGHYIKQNSMPDDRIMVLGSEPEIYFYAQRKAAIEAIYMYDLMYVNEYARELQELTIEQAEKNDPQWVVLVNVSVSWLGSKDSEQLILEWASQFLQNYTREGVVDIIPDGTKYIFGPQSNTYKPRSSGHILLFKKRL